MRITLTDDEYRLLEPQLRAIREQKLLITTYNRAIEAAKNVILEHIEESSHRDNLLSDLNLLIKEFP